EGFATWRTLQFDGLRVRMVEYSAGYIANHWCKLGHLLFCLEGEMLTILKDGSEFPMKAGMSYQVSDRLSEHRSSTKTGAKLIIIDGDFLRS
ncbi:MAG: DHCW motif cupin fold protein, partial [Chryseolinea sp.]